MSRHDHFPRGDAQRLDALHHATAALAARWRGAFPIPRHWLAAFDAVAAMDARAAAEALAPLFGDVSWIGAELEAAIALLGADPFARPPLRPFGGGGEPCGLLLGEYGPIRLSLRLYPYEAGQRKARSVMFVPGAVACHILSDGGAAIVLHEVDLDSAEAAGGFSARRAAPSVCHPPRPLGAGETLCLDTGRQGLTLADAVGDVLFLELAVQPPSPLPTRVHDIASGRLMHVAASRRDNSFRLMAMALLRTLGHVEASPLFAMATDDDDFALRWAAMREWVALDAGMARGRLTAMAVDDPHPELRAAAAATLRLYDDREAPSPCRS